MARARIVAIDVGAHSVKVVEVARRRGALALTRAASADRLGDGHNGVDLAATVRRALRDAGIRGGDCVVALPRARIVLRRLSKLPVGLGPAQLREVIQLQAISQLPFPEDEAVFDYLNAREQQDGTAAEVMAARSRDVEAWLEPVREAGLAPVAVAPSVLGPLALVRTHDAANDGTSRRLLLLNMGHETTDLVLVHGNAVSFSRSMPIGASHLSDTSSQGLDSLVSELSRTIEMCAREIGGAESDLFDEVCLFGGGTKLLIDTDQDAQQTEPVSVADVLGAALKKPIRPIAYPSELAGTELMDALPLGYERFATAVGLAMDHLEDALEVNLLPAADRARRAQSDRTRSGLAYVAASVALIAIAYFVGGSLVANQEAAVAALDAEIAQYRSAQTVATRTLAEMRAMSQLVNPRHSMLDIVRELTALLPDRLHIAVTSFSIEPSGKVTIRCEADSHEAISTAAADIGSSMWFENVRPGQITTVQRDDKQIRQCAITMSIVEAADVLAAKRVGTPIRTDDTPQTSDTPVVEAPTETQRVLATDDQTPSVRGAQSAVESAPSANAAPPVKPKQDEMASAAAKKKGTGTPAKKQTGDADRGKTRSDAGAGSKTDTDAGTRTK